MFSLTEFAEKQKSEPNNALDKVTQAFLGMFANDLQPKEEPPKDKPEGPVKPEVVPARGAETEVQNLLNTMAEPTMKGCIQLLEQLNVQSTFEESE